MNFDFTDDQQAIKRTANEFLAARFKPRSCRELAEAGEYDDGIWDEMSRARAGRASSSPRSTAARSWARPSWRSCSEELGYALAPSPFFSATPRPGC